MADELDRSRELLRLAGMHRQHTEALSRATGDHYNIFKILGIGHYEVRTHSPILGDLLNPKGTHCQGDAFLRLFVKRMGIATFDTASAKLVLEHHIGAVSEKSGGRIDIVISDKRGNAIFIENKIYAADQDNQLQRYRERNPQAELYYLTLNGGLPSGFDEKRLKEVRATCISYATDIRDWLIVCQQEASSLPHVRETISQYLYLVRELTGQSTSQAMNEELIRNITANGESLAAYFSLTSEMENVKAALVAKLDGQLAAAAQAAGLERLPLAANLDVKHSGIDFTTANLARHNLRICFSFDRGGFQDLDFGFAKVKKEIPCEFADKLLAEFRKQFPTFEPRKPTEWWPAWADFETPYDYWGDEAFEGIQSGDLAANVEGKLIVMSKVAMQILSE